MSRMMNSAVKWRWVKIALLLLAVAAAWGVFHHTREPFRRSRSGAEKGVTFRGQAVQKMHGQELSLIVARAARHEGRAPVNAVIDQATGSIIPELNGIVLDLDRTVGKIMEAAPYSEVEPVFREVVPDIRLRNFPSLPVYQGNPRKMMIALMINVAWDVDQSLPGMLSTLESFGARGTFFLTGIWIEKNRSQVELIHAGGHELANHGYSDAELFPDLNAEEMARSLRKTNEMIYELSGTYPGHFTPHKGEYNQLTLDVVSRQNMRTVMWTVDTVDWQKPGVEIMKQRVLEGLAPGVIILMHPTGDTVELLNQLLPLIREKGLRVVPVSELLDPSWPVFSNQTD